MFQTLDVCNWKAESMKHETRLSLASPEIPTSVPLCDITWYTHSRCSCSSVLNYLLSTTYAPAIVCCTWCGPCSSNAWKKVESREREKLKKQWKVSMMREKVRLMETCLSDLWRIVQKFSKGSDFSAKFWKKLSKEVMGRSSQVDKKEKSEMLEITWLTYRLFLSGVIKSKHARDGMQNV